ncbi:uncharacterized protein LOC118747303 [Rhagoletis pomonella]|uniref:uncharacterized protein LOC118747303 n=1 Tax=Rhagoletis pomonella TaxID=28610 RepID=UPI001782E479|nr:uncharacterized protein LOC118747303 [Rhagoletis pomonella]
MDSVFLKKLLLKSLGADRKCYIYLHSEWHDDAVSLYLKYSNSGLYYKGLLLAKDFEEPAAELEIPLNDFRGECKSVLTSNIGLPGFEIELDNERKILRVNKNEEFCIQYLEIKLTEADKSYEMLEVAIKIIDTDGSGNETQKTNDTIARLIEDVEQVLREKEEWKQKMLQKFLALLNTKKQKISTLQKKIENMDKKMKSAENMNAAHNFQASTGDGMDHDFNEGSNSDAIDSPKAESDFDAPTQRLTPPNTNE